MIIFPFFQDCKSFFVKQVLKSPWTAIFGDNFSIGMNTGSLWLKVPKIICINLGRLLLVSPGIQKQVPRDDRLKINIETGSVHNQITGEAIAIQSCPDMSWIS